MPVGIGKKILSFFVGSSNRADKTLDAIISGADKLKLTDEERLDYQKDTYNKWQELQFKLAENGTGTAINRRIISWAVVIVLLFNFQLAVGLAIFEQEKAVQHIISLSKSFWIGEAFVAVIAFYFAPHLIGKKDDK